MHLGASRFLVLSPSGSSALETNDVFCLAVQMHYIANYLKRGHGRIDSHRFVDEEVNCGKALRWCGQVPQMRGLLAL